MKLMLILLLSISTVHGQNELVHQKKESVYKKLLEKADSYYNNCELEKAKIGYEKALQIKPNKLPKNRIDNINVEVLNEISFPKYIDYSLTDSVNSIKFKVIITNHSTEKIPDLGVSSRSDNLNFYVNGKLSNPISLYNGLEVLEGEKVIKPGDSAEYYVTWVLTPDSGKLTTYGNSFTVYWEYCGIKSLVKKVNIEAKTAHFVEKK